MSDLCVAPSGLRAVSEVRGVEITRTPVAPAIHGGSNNFFLPFFRCYPSSAEIVCLLFLQPSFPVPPLMFPGARGSDILLACFNQSYPHGFLFPPNRR